MDYGKNDWSLPRVKDLDGQERSVEISFVMGPYVSPPRWFIKREMAATKVFWAKTTQQWEELDSKLQNQISKRVTVREETTSTGPIKLFSKSRRLRIKGNDNEKILL